jgi:hypothetical protein
LLNDFNLAETWNSVWGILGPVIVVVIILYFYFPEKFERILTHILKLVAYFSKQAERKVISKEVEHIISTPFAKELGISEVPRVVIEWGAAEDAILNLKENLLLIVLREGSKYRHENIARALFRTIPYLLSPQVKTIYDQKFVDILSAHLARSFARDYPPVVDAINDFIKTEIEKDENLSKLASMLVEIDDQSLLTRILIPELVKVAGQRYPHRDPAIDQEVLDLTEMLYKLVRSEEQKPVLCGKYFRLMVVRVARPEKIISGMLEPHVKFVKHSLDNCPTTESIYIVAAGRNINAAEALKLLLLNELGKTGIKLRITREQKYTAVYRDKPHVKVYVCGIEIERIEQTLTK